MSTIIYEKPAEQPHSDIVYKVFMIYHPRVNTDGKNRALFSTNKA
jgi:hypothetical protein